MVLLDRNPLEDIEATRTIRAVILRGTVHDRAALDAMLSRARAQVAAWNEQAKEFELRAGQSDSLEYFAWRALELRQCDIADVLQILPTDGRRIEASCREVSITREECRALDQRWICFRHIADLVAQSRLLFAAQRRKGPRVAAACLIVEPLQAG